MQWGPWRSGLDPAELRARLRSLRTAAHLLLGARGTALCALLRGAEHDPDDLERAALVLEGLARLDFRRVVGTYAALHRA
ncbi:hypothetical protein [Methylobacterium sp. JK268]